MIEKCQVAKINLPCRTILILLVGLTKLPEMVNYRYVAQNTNGRNFRLFQK